MNRLLTHPATIAATTASALLIVVYLAQAAAPAPAQQPKGQNNAKDDAKNGTDKTDRDEPKGMVTAHIVRLKKTQPSLMERKPIIIFRAKSLFMIFRMA